MLGYSPRAMPFRRAHLLPFAAALAASYLAIGPAEAGHFGRSGCHPPCCQPCYQPCYQPCFPQWTPFVVGCGPTVGGGGFSVAGGATGVGGANAAARSPISSDGTIYEPEPWVASGNFPPILLTNQAQFTGHQGANWASGLAGAFLIETLDKRVIAATAKHLFEYRWGGLDPTMQPSEIEGKMQYWRLLPRNNPAAAVELDKLAVPAADLEATGDYKLDWVFMTLKNPSAALPVTPLKVRETPVQVGERVYIVGFDWGDRRTQRVYPSTVTYRDTENGFDVAPLGVSSQGFSGGPILDAAGYVVGTVGSARMGKDIAPLYAKLEGGKSRERKAAPPPPVNPPDRPSTKPPPGQPSTNPPPGQPSTNPPPGQPSTNPPPGQPSTNPPPGQPSTNPPPR